jgi:chromosome partitioning protein
VFSMAKIISIANCKGGISKTTSTINLGAALTQLEKKVLLIDADPQSSLTLYLGFQPDEINSLYEVLLKECSAQEAIYKTDVDGLFVLPSKIELSLVEIKISHMARREYILKQQLEPILDSFDFILIDNMPSIGILAVNTLSASDFILIPTEASYLSYKGLEIMTKFVEDIRLDNINPSLSLLGIFVSLFDTRPVHSQTIIDALKDTYNEHFLDIYIKKSIKFQEASLTGKTIFQHSGLNFDGAKSYLELAKEVLVRVQE